MLLRETILCAATPTTGPGAIAIHDLQTGSTLASFKQTNAAPHGTAVVQSQDGQGGVLFAAQHDKSILNVYNFQKVLINPSFLLLCCSIFFFLQDQISLKIVLPEKLSCITVDHSGEFCAGGTSQGRIYLWEVSLRVQTSRIIHQIFLLGRVGYSIQLMGRALPTSDCPQVHTRWRCAFLGQRRFRRERLVRVQVNLAGLCPLTNINS
jgi:hypothetical protein